MNTANYRLPEIPGTEIKDITPETIQTFINGNDLLNMKRDFIPMLFGDLIPQVGVGALDGASDTGKSMLLRQMTMCVVSNTPFIGMPIHAIYNRAIVVCSEDDDFAISYLLRRQNKTMGISAEQAKNIQFLFDTSNLVETLNSELSKNPADLIIIDAFGDVFNGKDLNQNNQVRAFLNDYSQLANRYKCSIVFLHHTGKRTEQGAPSKNNAIGSQGFEAKMRWVAELRNDLHLPDIKHFCIVKGNYLPQSEKSSSIVLKMDENLTFTDTGERVPYDKLNEGATGKPQKKEPSDIEDVMHYNCIRSIFIDGKQYSQNELVRKLQHYWTIGDKVARRFVDYLEQKQWIADVSKVSTRRSYRNNLPA